MKTLRELRAVESNKEAQEFSALARFIMAHDGKFSDAIQAVQQGGLANVRGLTTRTVNILKETVGREIGTFSKAAVNPLVLAGSAFQDISAISAGFVNSLSSAGAFDAMLPDMAQIPLRSSTVGAINVSAVGYVINEGQMKPLSRLSVSGVAQNPLKVSVAIIISQELARSALVASGQLISRELRNTVALASDLAFINSISAGVIAATSYGTNATAVRMDLEWLLRQVSLKQTSKPYLLTTPAIAGTLSQKENGGQAAFPDLSPQGGTISGIPTLVSDAVTPGNLMLVDASMIAGSGGSVMLEQIEDGVVQMESVPDSPPSGTTTLLGLWQNNETGIRVERYIIGQKLTPNAVAIINAPNGYVVSNSP